MNEPCRRASIYQLMPRIGAAIWLLTVYICAAEDCGDGWMVVNGGRPASDKNVAYILGVTPWTVALWRKKLLRLGYLRIADLVPAGGYVLVVRAFPEMLRFRDWMWDRGDFAKEQPRTSSEPCEPTSSDLDFLKLSRVSWNEQVESGRG